MKITITIDEYTKVLNEAYMKGYREGFKDGFEEGYKKRDRNDSITITSPKFPEVYYSTKDASKVWDINSTDSSAVSKDCSTEIIS